MMSKRIRSMIDEIFSEMKMTVENLALRDELMANAQARYEDAGDADVLFWGTLTTVYGSQVDTEVLTTEQ